MSDPLDEDAQPKTQAFNWARRRDSGTDELIGICRGILADGAIVIEEAKFLYDWLRRNEPVLKTFAGKKLFDILTMIFVDGKFEGPEEDALVEVLLRFIGGTPQRRPGRSIATSLPLCIPEPEVEFPGNHFCFTGKFVFGTRAKCESCVTVRGGGVHKHPIQSTRFLFIGELGSRDWIHSNSGRKIEKAIEIREKGMPISLICEEHWIRHVKSHTL